MRLLSPTLEMKDAVEVYIRDFEEHGETVAPGAARFKGRSYETWLADLRELETRPAGGYVTGNAYLWFDADGVLAGMIALRHTLNAELLQSGGHIGYGVRPSMRRRGHASAMLAAVLPLARERGLSRVLITCDKENIGSARTIQKNGGELENEVLHEGRLIQRYWISL